MVVGGMNKRASLVAPEKKLMGIGAMDDRGQIWLGGFENLRDVDKTNAGHGDHGLRGGGQGRG